MRIEGETVWLTQAQLVELFQSSKANISEHIKNIYTERELTPEATVRKFRTVQKEGNREVERNIEHYNLDLIISLGYRVKSSVATKFRIWATKTLKQHLSQGYTINKKRIGENYEKLNKQKTSVDYVADGIQGTLFAMFETERPAYDITAEKIQVNSKI